MNSIHPVYQLFALFIMFNLYTVAVSYYSARKAVKYFVEDFDAGYKPGKRGNKK